MFEKFIYVLGGNYNNYLNINVLTGEYSKLINLLERKRSQEKGYSLILDVQDEKIFPFDKNDNFWFYFTSAAQGKRRILFILHNRNAEIEQVIKEQKESSSYVIDGPLFFSDRLIDKTPITDIEKELILFAIYRLYPDVKIQDDLDGLNGVLSIRIFFPEAFTDLKDKIINSYKNDVEYKGADIPKIPEITEIHGESPTGEFKIRDFYNPFKSFDLEYNEEFSISENIINSIVDESFSNFDFNKISEKIKDIKNTEMREKIKNIDIPVQIKGAGSLLSKLREKQAENQKNLKDFKFRIENISELLVKFKIKAKNEGSNLIKGYEKLINNILLEFNELKTFGRFLLHRKFLIIPPFIFIFFIMLLLNIAPHFSLLGAVVGTILIFYFYWKKVKEAKRLEIYDMFEKGHRELNDILKETFNKFIDNIWERSISMLNIKVKLILHEYLKRAIKSFEIIERYNPDTLIKDIFSKEHKLIYLLPSINLYKDEIVFSDFDGFPGCNKWHLQNYFMRNFFELSKEIKFRSEISEFDQRENGVLEILKDTPNLGILWDSISDIDLDEKNPRVFLYKPEDVNMEGLSRIKNFKYLSNIFSNVIFVIGLYKFNKGER